MKSLRSKFPVVTLTGPRQSGKTTLLKALYKDLPYISLEDLDSRIFALNDPRGFLSNYPNGVVIDEAQNVPDLFSYIQGIVDARRDVHFVLSGSQNFLLLQKVTQSLAGRAAILKLLPLGISELKTAGIGFDNYEELIYNGSYPAIYDRDNDPSMYYPSYISTYVERDIREIKNIENINRFTQFIKLCAGRAGQLVNLSSLAMDAGISPNTAKSWLSLLEASYIVYFLQPYYKNYNKRISKAPKMYFYDTGLLCSLLGIQNAEQVSTYYQKGALFENLIINEFYKSYYNRGKQADFYYWQTKTRQEIDLIIDRPDGVDSYEIKSGKTMNESYFANLKYWQKHTGIEADRLNVIYGGESSLKTSFGNCISWRDLNLSLMLP